MKLYRDDFSLTPGYGTALSAYLLEQGEDSLLAYRPGREVLFSGQDKASPDFMDAVGAAKHQGFLPLRRSCGGRAVVFHPGCLALTWTSFSESGVGGIDSRFAKTAGWIKSALRTLGLPAEIGELPGEYCPGEWSVSVSGKKVAGVAQRVVKDAAQVSVIITLFGASGSNEMLVPLYGALGLELDPERTGEVGIEENELLAALLAEIGEVDDAGKPTQDMIDDAKQRLQGIVF